MSTLILTNHGPARTSQPPSLPSPGTFAREWSVRILVAVPPPYVLAIDQGTTSSRALIVDAEGQVAGLGQQAFTQHFPQPGWVEHDPMQIWTSTLDSVGVALAQAGLAANELSAIGVTNQRETVVVWDRKT